MDITILIPTIGRPNLIKFVMDGLRNQSFTDFKVLVISKSADAKTMQVIEHFNAFLDIKFLIQSESGIIRAYNEGIRNIDSDIIIFTDDDAVPDKNWVREHISTYEHGDISGVSGDVIPANIVGGILKPIHGKSEVINYYSEPKILQRIGNKLWNRPIEGQEGYLAYISKGGYSRKNVNLPVAGLVNSLLCMAANMSILSSALRDYQLPSFFKQGINFEQVLGWYLWKKGHRMIFNPRAKVYHVKHKQSMSRFLNLKNVTQATIEDELIFYYLLPFEKKLSLMHKIVSLAYNFLIHIKKTQENWKYEMAIIKGIFLGNIRGLNWIVSSRKMS